MDQISQDTLLVLSQQRNTALDALAHVQALLAQAQRENEQLKASLKNDSLPSGEE